MSRIKIKRLPSSVGALRKIEIYIDNICVYKISNNEEKLFELPPGKHTIYVKEIKFSNKIELNLQEEETVNLVFSPKDSPQKQQIVLTLGVVIMGCLLHFSRHLAFLFLLFLLICIVYKGIKGELFVPLVLREEI